MPAEDYIAVPGASCAFPRAEGDRIDCLIRDIHAGALTLADSVLVADIVAAYRHLVTSKPLRRREIIRSLGGEVTI